MKFHKYLSYLCACLIALQACTNPNPSTAQSTPEDPFEPFNRQMHEVNIALDRAILNPVATAYDSVTDPEFQQGVSNVASNLSEPKNAVNHALQGKVEPMFINITRFIYNSSVGIGGLFDPASQLGLLPSPTSFDQTLASWGTPAGPYIELPVLGPNSVRSAAARLVDTQLNPFSQYILQNYGAEAYRNYISFAILSGINSRAYYGNLVDMLLYQSPDSYLATRSAYLQNQAYLQERLENRENDQAETVELEDFYAE